MRTQSMVRAAATVALVAAMATATVALQENQDKPASRLGAATQGTAQEASAPTESAKKAKWKEFATPSEGHRELERRIGRWSLHVKAYEKPGAAATESTGTSEAKWIKGGRFVEETVRGTYEGQPFEGTCWIGYDNLKEKYVTSWVDNMSTGIIAGELTWDPARKTFRGESECPDVMAGKYVRTRTVETWADDDHYTARSYAPGADGKERLEMEIVATRQKGS